MKRVALPSGIELDTMDEGPRDAPALIFLHGFPESHRTWQHQVAHLSDRYRCIAPDQRGYRGSSKPQDVASYTADKLIGDVFHLAEALEVGSFTVMGHDWGGAIAWGVALLGQATGKVTRAVIANAPHPAIFPRLLWTDAEQRAASQYIRLFRDPESDRLLEAGGLGAVLLKAFAGQSGPSMQPGQRMEQLAEWMDRDAGRAMLNWYRAAAVEVPPLDAPLQEPEGWSAPPLPPLSLPTLVIWGMDDTALLPSNLDGLDQYVTALKIAEVPGAGHFVPWEAPDAVNAALDEFLSQEG